ncbi:MAG: hypothetical protein ACT4PE_15825 [Candidatus Eiseniibacteriota bacterium]
MPLEVDGAVLFLEVRAASRSGAPQPRLEDVFARARMLVEAQPGGKVWPRTGGPGVAGSFRVSRAADAFAALHRLRTELRADPAAPAVLVAAGLGRGEELDASRLAAEAFRGLGRRDRRITGASTAEEASDRVLGALCATMDSLVSGWTAAQWQAIHRRDQGRTLQQIGDDLGIAYQNVSKRLIAARYALYTEVLEAAGLVFSRPGFRE